MDIIFGVIGIGCLVGIGLYIGFEGMNALIEISAMAISFIIKKTLETKKSDDEWSAGPPQRLSARRTIRVQSIEKIKNFFARDF